ncbi:hypothetical protein GF337_17070 [candidate division KSB1 bacterium]|nr:hypothetical protein [candidate division KSB1 bacterium]
MKTNKIFLLFLVMLSIGFAYKNLIAMQIDGYGNIALMIIDPSGRKTGYNILEDKTYDGIPGSDVGAAGIGMLNENGTMEADPNSPTITAMVSNKLSGEYKIIVSGFGKTHFGVNVMASHENGSRTNVVAGGFVDSATVVEVSFKYDRASKENTEIKKLVTDNTFIKDIELCYHFEYIKDEGIYNSLKKKAENAIKQHEKGNNNAAVNILNAFINEVNAQKGKKIDEWEAENVLIYDAQELIDKWKE